MKLLRRWKTQEDEIINKRERVKPTNPLPHFFLLQKTTQYDYHLYMFITIDMGASNTRVASSWDLSVIYKTEKFNTNPDLPTQKNLIRETINKLSDNQKVNALCLGVPGKINKNGKKFTRLPNYPPLNGKSFKDLIEMDAKSLLFVENDVTLAGIAEAVMGEGRNYTTLAYLSLGTGVGGVKVEKKDRKLVFDNPEVGHHIIVENGRLNKNCGDYGCLEAYTSGSSFLQIYKTKPEDCEDIEVWADYANYLALGISHILDIWKPQILILGGSISNKFEYFYPDLLFKLKKIAHTDIPEIKTSKLADSVGLYGGLIYLNNALAVSQ